MEFSVINKHKCKNICDVLKWVYYSPIMTPETTEPLQAKHGRKPLTKAHQTLTAIFKASFGTFTSEDAPVKMSIQV